MAMMALMAPPVAASPLGRSTRLLPRYLPRGSSSSRRQPVHCSCGILDVEGDSGGNLLDMEGDALQHGVGRPLLLQQLWGEEGRKVRGGK